jgi:hypothetical protein
MSDKYITMINVFAKTAATAASALMLTGCVGVMPFAMDSGRPSSGNPPAPEVQPCPAVPDFTETSDRGDNPGEPSRPPGFMPDEEISEQLGGYAQKLVGYSEENAESCVSEAGFGWRVVERNGEFFPVTMDYRFDRINASVYGRTVTKISLG